ncbi:RabGAP/TBC [Linnemannia elongata AG-77]|uniref:RabGAP/TBC n=1 Tax=Linnemannia elongata AG-77 TaxID=1314771 RepID=A0A197KFC7_9FUNG|nr:RabGAP/TBC [Linnemannia elongata AG-77]
MTTTTSTEPPSWPSPTTAGSFSQKSASISRLDLTSSESISTVVPISSPIDPSAQLDIHADPTNHAALDLSFHSTAVNASPQTPHLANSFVTATTTTTTTMLAQLPKPINKNINVPLDLGTDTVHGSSLPPPTTTIVSALTRQLINASNIPIEHSLQASASASASAAARQKEVIQPDRSSFYPSESSRIFGRPSVDSTDHKDTHDQEIVSTSSFSIEDSAIAYTEMDMSMTSPTRHTKSPPTSASSSLTSTGRRRMIAESSMILSGGAGQNAVNLGSGIGGGALSPAWSMTSIPRDISANYCRSGDDSTAPAIAPMDEKLYGLVDRYGFLVEEGRTPTADRKNGQTSTISSSQTSVRGTQEAKKQAKIVAKEQERSLKWARMAKQYTSEANEIEYSFSDHQKFVSRVYKGIPDCWRAAAWSHLITKRSAGFDPNIRQIYHDMLEISSPEEEQIDLDIPRTMHGHIMFRTRFGPGQCALFKVLKAYSNYNNRVGYCQGMASVVATMLTFFDAEKTFVLLAQLFDRYNINELVVPGFPALFEAFFIQEELTKIYAPNVFQALETMGIATPSYASRWYITLYSAGVVPYRTLLRIWDILLLEGFDWLYFMALALLKYHEQTLVLNNFERTMEMLNAKMDIQDDERLLKIARRLFRQAKQTGIVAKLKRTYAAKMKQPA